MKNLIFVLLCSVSIHLTAQTPENLYYYCKLWGLLKYYTPEAGRGKVNVDELFLSTWPAFTQCKDQKDFDAFLQGTILSRFPSINKKASQIEIQVFKNFSDTNEYRVLVDFNWVKNDYLSPVVQAKLIGGLNTYKGVKKKWMKTSWGYTQHKEKNIAFLTNSDSMAFRALTLFKYWNWVEYFFAYKNLMDTNWDQDLKDGLTSLGDHLGFYLKMKNLSAKLQDEHSSFAGSNFIKYSTMFSIYFKKVDGVHRVISTDYVSVIGYHFENKKNKTILNIGDTLVSINGMRVEVWDSVVSSFISFSKPLDQIRFKDILAYHYSSYPVYMQPKELIITVKKMGVCISDTIRGDGSVWDSLYRDEPRFDRKKYESKHADIGFMSMVNREDANARTLKKHFKEHEQKKVIIIDQTFQTMMNNYLAPFFQTEPRKVARAFSPMPTFPGIYKLVDFNLYYFSTSTIDFIYKAFFPIRNILYPQS